MEALRHTLPSPTLAARRRRAPLFLSHQTDAHLSRHNVVGAGVVGDSLSPPGRHSDRESKNHITNGEGGEGWRKEGEKGRQSESERVR